MSKSAGPKQRCEGLKRLVSVLPGAGSEPVTTDGKQVERCGVVCGALHSNLRDAGFWRRGLDLRVQELLPTRHDSREPSREARAKRGQKRG